MISKLANDSLRLDQLRPGQMKHSFTSIVTQAGDPSTANASTYKDKFRAGQVRNASQWNFKSPDAHLSFGVVYQSSCPRSWKQ